MKEEAEKNQIQVFATLFNDKYETDYVVGPPELQNSITDRRLISSSGKYSYLNIQIKEIVELDATLFTKEIMGNVKVRDTNIFKLLTPALNKIEKKYGKNAEGITLVLNVGVDRSWMEDYVPPEGIKTSSFNGIYCMGLPTHKGSQGYIFSLKEITKKTLNEGFPAD